MSKIKTQGMGQEYTYPSEDELRLRRSLSGLTDDDAVVLARLSPVIAPHIPQIIDEFYAHIQQHEPLRTIISEHTTIDRLKMTFRSYCTELFSGNYGIEYLIKRIQVGLTHARVGLPLAWYQGMHLYLREALIGRVNIVVTTESDIDLYQVRIAIDRLMSLDQLLASDAYVVAYTVSLREHTERTNAAAAAKSSFLAAASHELRTPLSAILGFAELAMNSGDNLSAKTMKQLNSVVRNARGLMAIINDLLDLSRIESGKWELKLENVDIQLLLTEIIADVEQLLGQKPVRLLKSFLRQPPIVVTTDRGKLSQIILNIASNAAKFTAAGEIEIDAYQAAGSLSISVRDTGPGMSSAEVGQIFEEFRQLKQVGNISGVGLGLTISRNLANLLGGKIAVESVVGKGTTFTVVLPNK